MSLESIETRVAVLNSVVRRNVDTLRFLSANTDAISSAVCRRLLAENRVLRLQACRLWSALSDVSRGKQDSRV